MKLRLTYVRAQAPVDLELQVEGAATVGDVARALVRNDPLRPYDPEAPATLALVEASSQVPLSADDPVVTSALASGSTVSVVAPSAVRPAGQEAAAVLKVVAGPDAPREFPLRTGSNYIGRSVDMDVRLSDPLVSKRHAKVNVGPVIEIIDNASVNGVELDGTTVERAVLRPSDRVTLGETVLEVTATAAPPARATARADDVHAFVRPPRVVAAFPEEKHAVPEVPARPSPQRFPLIALVTPVLIAGVLFAVTRSLTSLLFVALSPLMMLGQWVESRWSGRKQYAEAVADFRESLEGMAQLVRARQDEERSARLKEHPSTRDLVEAVERRSDLVWCRRADLPGFLTVRLATGADDSRVALDLTSLRSGERELTEEVLAAAAVLRQVNGVPIVADLARDGAVGVAGRGEEGAAAARGLVAQLAAAHSPADLVLAACVGAATVDRWSWMLWLPHTQGVHSPLSCDLLASGAVGSVALVSTLESLVAARTEQQDTDRSPAVVLVVEDDAVIDRSRLVALAENGPTAGVHVVWVAPDRSRLPATCRAYLDCGADGGPVVGYPAAGRLVPGAVTEPLALNDALAMARSLSPLVDAGAVVDDATDLPRSVSFLSLAGTPLGEDPGEVVERWLETDSLASRRAPGPRRSHGSLRALVGQSATGPLHLDLRSQGPHALVGGTTGAGKSELLQAWVLGMASAHSPERVTFLFVDYKGGSAFGDCVRLPHSVGLVTDLSPHLVRRALVSLSAELRHREHVLNAAKAKDLAEMERNGDPSAPPSLVIVVDEFAALAHDVPEFVDGVVNIAQRGRSLGLHLILATQRPAGVIKDNLRANTNLRIALRMADADDSVDILGTDAAAAFDPGTPGRAAVRSGPGTLTPFQSAYAGGWTSSAVIGPQIDVRELSLRGGSAWEDPAPAAPPVDGPNDLDRLVSTISAAALACAVPAPRRPWLPELPSVVDLGDLPSTRRDEQLVFALADDPGAQSQPPVSFDPDRDGNVAIIGTGGSGKSTVLRTLAAAAGFTVRGGPVHVYGLDFGARGLSMLETLPHVGSIVAGDDVERVQRLLRWARQRIDERSSRYSAVQASSVTEYRSTTGHAEEPRILLLLDGLAAFRQAFDTGGSSSLVDLLTSIAADGRPVGVHVAVTADRVASVPSALASLIPKRLVLRAADDNELSLSGAPRDLFTQESPAGRGWLDGREVQVAVLGGSSSLAAQGRAIERLADAIRRNTQWPEAEAIRRLPEVVDLLSLPATVGDAPVLGLEDESLEPLGMPTSGTFVVAGPPGSGRTSTVVTMVRSVQRAVPDVRTALFSPSRSPLVARLSWDRMAVGQEAAADLADELRAALPEGSGRWLVVVESPQEFLNSSADLPLQDLVKELRQNEHLVLAEGDTQSLAGSWPLLQALRFSRRGIVLQPDQSDGDLLLRTTFPRVKRADFPSGRGLLVREGRVVKVQVAHVDQ